MTISPHEVSTQRTAQVIDLACAIQAIPAPTFAEAQRAQFLLEQFHGLGLADVHLDSAGNALARFQAAVQPPTAKAVLVSAHLDTVFPAGTSLQTRRLPDRVFGAGIGDNAVGLAALVGLGALLQEHLPRLPGDVWLAANVAEEGLGDLRGMRAIVDRFGEHMLAYVVLEGMGLGTVLNRGLGVERYQIEVHTPGGHSWVDYGQPSAIHEICRMVSEITGLELPKNPCTTLNVGIIQGGTSVNSIAGNASIELDLRSEDSLALAGLVRAVRAITGHVQRPGVEVKLHRIGKRLAGQLPENHPLVTLGLNTLTELGVPARLDIASTDANLPLSRGYPAVCVGITSGNYAHTPEEFIYTAPVQVGLSQLYRIVTKAWKTLP